MGIFNQLRWVAVAILFLTIQGCNKLDVRGMFVSYDDVDDRIRQSLDYNQSHPFKVIRTSHEQYTLHAMGDSHVGGTVNLDRFFSESERDSVAAVVMVGDLCSGKEEDYRTYVEHLPDSSLPCFNLIGNHDLYFGGWDTFFKNFGSSTYYFTVETPTAKDLFLCLDTGSGTLGKVQMDWLEEVLRQERPQYRHCVLFTHNNFYRFRKTSSTNPLLEELHYLLDLIVQNNIGMVVMGHDHAQDVDVFGNTTLVTMDALMDSNEDAGYLKVQVGPNSIGHELVRF
jgi:hypothetical protein